ncbi:ejaculatory bulb-specific protein 3 [Bicyclus anynana]|uniref:Ejaculatory bulb-specific protein 3 n=1 Tax=Bicyclus anynana TaxID=110368 RepID=A0A6J1NBZ3_BICAN|nr:ejaculatory bulb-specific protein 3 [Bicyclus anynana]
MIAKVIGLLCVVLALALAEDKYTSKYDNFNITEVLENPRLRQAYGNCMLGKGKCTPEGKELTEHMQEALETGCKKCTDAQIDGTATVTDYLIKHDPALWKELTAKFDPTGTYRKQYEDRAREKGIVIPQD